MGNSASSTPAHSDDQGCGPGASEPPLPCLVTPAPGNPWGGQGAVQVGSPMGGQPGGNYPPPLATPLQHGGQAPSQGAPPPGQGMPPPLSGLRVGDASRTPSSVAGGAQVLQSLAGGISQPAWWEVAPRSGPPSASEIRFEDWDCETTSSCPSHCRQEAPACSAAPPSMFPQSARSHAVDGTGAAPCAAPVGEDVPSSASAPCPQQTPSSAPPRPAASPSASFAAPPVSPTPTSSPVVRRGAPASYRTFAAAVYAHQGDVEGGGSKRRKVAASVSAATMKSVSLCPTSHCFAPMPLSIQAL